MDKFRIIRQRDLLPANNEKSNIHKRMGSTVCGKKIVIGKGDVVDEFSNSELEDCEVRIYSGGRYTSSTFHECVFKNC